MLQPLKQVGNLYLETDSAAMGVIDIAPTGWLIGQYPNATNFRKEDFGINEIVIMDTSYQIERNYLIGERTIPILLCRLG